MCFFFCSIATESQEQIMESAVKSPFLSVFEYAEFCQISADYALSTANVQTFLKRNDLRYDLIINEEFFHDSFLMFAHKFKAPIVTISTVNIFTISIEFVFS